LKKLILVLIAISLITSLQAKEPLRLRNDAWPPFILTGKTEGTAEQLVCEALRRSGWGCSVEVEDWESVLNQARIGAIDGVAAAWLTPERETYMLFSEPYLTNRIVAVINNDNPVDIESLADLSGLRVALVGDYAYGEEVESATDQFEVLKVKNSERGIKAVLSGKADVALVDELVARSELYKSEMKNLTALDTILAFRSLHLAISRKNPLAAVIIDDFHRSYKLMLADGTVNEILNVDWLATDFGQAGNLNVVLRPGVSLDDLSAPTGTETVYALEDSEYQYMRNRNLDSSRVNYQVDGESYSSLQTALDSVFGKDTVCKHKNFTSQFDCSDLFKKR
jgi:polar amino acid transport system substrate-binding protein